MDAATYSGGCTINIQDFARLTSAERLPYITTAASRLGLSELIIEKDYWVVWALWNLFSLSAAVGPFTFKGGTSLSKGFQAIERFSEDVDVSISRDTLGFGDDAYFYNTDSKQQAKRRVEEIREAVRRYTIQSILPNLRERIAQELGSEQQWGLEPGEPGSLRFQYPSNIRGTIGYIKPDVLIEFGHADTWPSHDVKIQPYLADAIDTFSGFIPIQTLDPQRTFWEKATLLHEIANREMTVSIPPRNSRHYYDIARLARNRIGADAIADTALLEAVVKFKNVFFCFNKGPLRSREARNLTPDVP